MCRSRDVSRSFVPDSGLVSAECRLRHTVPPGRPERPLPHLVVDFCSPLFLKDCVAVFSQDVVDAANPHTPPEEGKFRLRLLAELDAFVHFSSDVCFAQELARDVLSRSDSDSECGASSGNCGDFGHVLHVADPPLGRRSIQIVHVVDDFCFLRGSAPLRLRRRRRLIPAERAAPRSDCT